MTITLTAPLPAGTYQITPAPPAPGPYSLVPKVTPPPASKTEVVLWGPAGTWLNHTQAAQIAAWGFTTIMVPTQWLPGAGGSNGYVAGTPPMTPPFNFQRALAAMVPIAHAAGLKVVIGCYLDNYNNIVTPMVDWFDDAGWMKFLQTIAAFAGAAKWAGCDGIALDPELYHGGSWAGAYGTHTVPATQAQANTRGHQFQAAVSGGFPNALIYVYMSSKAPIPGLYVDRLRVYLGSIANPKTVPGPYAAVSREFFAGMQAQGGFGLMQFLDAVFYKPGNVEGGPYREDPDKGWARALADDVAGFAALGWSPECKISPFVWLDTDGSASDYVWAPSEWNAVRPAIHKAMQNNCYAIYQYEPGLAFSYAPYTLP